MPRRYTDSKRKSVTGSTVGLYGEKVAHATQHVRQDKSTAVLTMSYRDYYKNYMLVFFYVASHEVA